MNFDEFLMIILMSGAVVAFYTGLWHFGRFYHARQFAKAREEFEAGKHGPNYFGAGPEAE